MKLLRKTCFTGPNRFSTHSVIHCQIEAVEMQRISTAALHTLEPLGENVSPESRWAIFVRELADGEAFDWQHTLLEILHRIYEVMGVPPASAVITADGKAGQWELIAKTRDQQLSSLAVELSLAATSLLFAQAVPKGRDDQGLPAPPRKSIESLVRIARQQGLNFDTEALVHSAQTQKIPWRYLGMGILELGVGSQLRRMRSAVTSETRLISAKIAGNKAMTNRLLAQTGLPVPRQVLVQTSGELPSAVEAIGFPLVIKPLSGAEGKGVTANICTAHEIASAYDRARQHSSAVLVEAFIPGRDFRLLVVAGEVIAATERVSARVIGDGNSTIQALIDAENQRPRRDGRLLYKIKIDEAVNEMLARQGYSLQSVPLPGETVILRSTANFSTGGVPLDVTDVVHPDNRRMAVRAAREVGLDVAGVDFITPDIAQSYKVAGGAICEVNSLPGLRLHIAPETGRRRDVAGRILEKLFTGSDNGQIPIVAVYGHQNKQVTAFMLAHLLSFGGKTVGVAANRKGFVGGELLPVGQPVTTAALTDLILRNSGVDTAIIEVPFRELIDNGLGFEDCSHAILLGLEGSDANTRLLQTDQAKKTLCNALSATEALIVNADDPACVAAVGNFPLRRIFYVSLEQDNPVIREHVRLNGRALCYQHSGEKGAFVLRTEGVAKTLLETTRVPVLNSPERIRCALCACAGALTMGLPPEQIARHFEQLTTTFLVATSGVMEVQEQPFTLHLSPCHGQGLQQLVTIATGNGGGRQRAAIFPATLLLDETENCARLWQAFDLLVMHGSKEELARATAVIRKHGLPAENLVGTGNERAALAMTLPLMQEGGWLGIFSEDSAECRRRLLPLTAKLDTRPGSRLITTPAAVWAGRDLALATGGTWINGNAERVQAAGVCYYPGQLQRGDVFITTNPRHWKKSFADTLPQLHKMFELGAAAAIVDRSPENPPEHLPILLVDNSREALLNMARFARGRLKGKAICITGSAGKSTTKEMLYSVLKRQGLAAASRKNFNHGDGVPLSIAQTPAGADYGIYEFCVDLPSVTLPKAMIALPDVAIVTTIEEDHLMYYKTMARIADQKSLLFCGLVPGGTVILNRDNPYFPRLCNSAKAKGVANIVSFGFHREADVRVTAFVMSETGSEVSALVQGMPISYRLSQPGRHMIMNSLAVLAAVAAVGADISQAASDISEYEGLSLRVERHRVEMTQGHFDIIDDSFSANPASIRAGLDVLRLAKPGPGGRRVALLGAIKELGDNSSQIHASLSTAVLAAQVDKLFTIGDDMRHLRDQLPQALLGAHCDDGVELAQIIAAEVQAGDVIFIKGSLRSRDNTAPTVQALLAKRKEIKTAAGRSGDLPMSIQTPRGDGSEAEQSAAAALDNGLQGKRVTLENRRRRDDGRLEVLFAGDTSFGENYQAHSEARGLGNILRDEGYEYPLLKMRAILNDADLVVANLETPLTDLEKSPFQGVKSFIHWSDIEKAPRQLRADNIRAVSLANNHSFDYGREGYEQTLHTLARFGITYFGAGRSFEEACLPLVLQAPIGNQTFRLAVVGAYDYSKAGDEQFGCYANESRGGLCALDARTTRIVRKVKQQDPSCFVMVFPHWGANYRWKSAMQAKAAEELMLAGADLIVGHGAHMLQELEYRQGRWTIFSLGNFMFNSPGRYQHYQAPPYSLLAKLVVKPVANGLQRLLQLFPIVTDNKLTRYQARFVTDREFDEVWRLLTKEKAEENQEIHGLISGKSDRYGRYLEIDLGVG